MTAKLFGIVETLPVMTGTFGMFIVISCVIAIETLFHTLHHTTYQTPYHDMVVAIEKELMIVGATAFGFKLLFLSVPIDEDWLHAIEYADLAIPFTSVAFCMHGLILLLMSTTHVKSWIMAYHLHLVELLEKFCDINPKWWHWQEFLFSTGICSQMEIRILHNVFCEVYSIQRKALAFDEYVKRCYEKYLLSLVTISPISWAVICSFLILNFIRNILHIQLYSCPGPKYEDEHHDDHSCSHYGNYTTYVYYNSTSQHSYESSTKLDDHCHNYTRNYSSYGCIDETDDHTDDHRRYLAAAGGPVFNEEYLDCARQRSLVLYTCVGIFVLMVTLILAVFTRIYLLRIMRTKGVEKVEDYPVFLQLLESKENSSLESKKLSRKDLKDALTCAKNQTVNDELEELKKQKEFNDWLKEVFYIHYVQSLFGYESISRENSGDADDSAEAVTFQPVAVANAEPVPRAARRSNVGMTPLTLAKVSTPVPLEPVSAIIAPASSETPPGTAGQAGSLLKSGDNSDGPGKTNSGNWLGKEKPAMVKEFSDSAVSDVDPKEEDVRGPVLSVAETKGSGRFLLDDPTKQVKFSEQTTSVGGSAVSPAPPVVGNAATRMSTKSAKLSRNTIGLKSKVLRHQSVHNADRRIIAAAHLLSNTGREHHCNFDDDLKAIFVFGSPEFYFYTVDSMIMLISFYWALWLTNFETSALDLQNSNASLTWQLFSVLPGVLASVIFLMLCRSAALVHAMVVLDSEVLEETIEYDVSAKVLCAQLREKLISLLDKESDEPLESQFQALFNVIDQNGTIRVTRRVFQIFLQGLKITFSRLKWNQICHEIDRNADDDISYDELLLFTFPNSNVVQEPEKRRLHNIGQAMRERLAMMYSDVYLEECKERMIGLSNVSPRAHRKESFFYPTTVPGMRPTFSTVQPVSSGNYPGLIKTNSFKKDSSVAPLPTYASDRRLSAASVHSIHSVGEFGATPALPDDDNEEKQLDSAVSDDDIVQANRELEMLEADDNSVNYGDDESLKAGSNSGSFLDTDQSNSKQIGIGAAEGGQDSGGVGAHTQPNAPPANAVTARQSMIQDLEFSEEQEDVEIDDDDNFFSHFESLEEDDNED